VVREPYARWCESLGRATSPGYSMGRAASSFCVERTLSIPFYQIKYNSFGVSLITVVRSCRVGIVAIIRKTHQMFFRQTTMYSCASSSFRVDIRANSNTVGFVGHPNLVL